MQVTLKLVGTLADRLPDTHPLGDRPRQTNAVELGPDADMATLLNHVGLAVDSEYFAMINGQHVPAEELAARALVEGDAVVLVPPVKGG